MASRRKASWVMGRQTMGAADDIVKYNGSADDAVDDENCATPLRRVFSSQRLVESDIAITKQTTTSYDHDGRLWLN